MVEYWTEWIPGYGRVRWDIC
jgi:hypothetical protein